MSDKLIVQALQQKSRSEAEFHSHVIKPWGYYEVLDIKQHYQVKKISIKPGASISLQLHQRRSEHWIVIRGMAEVTSGDRVFILNVTESTYIPMHTKHRLKNIGDDYLVIIEVQTGDYLGEDDIIRFDDNYGRNVV